MEKNKIYNKIKNEFFYGSADYTKSQPDIFLPHKFEFAAPSKTGWFIDQVKSSMVNEKEILIYVHFPFCIRECVFCNSFPYKVNKEIQKTYIENIIKEISLFSDKNVFFDKTVKCIYFGGGTPTAFSDEDLKTVFEKIKSVVSFNDDLDLTIEAFPATIAEEKRIKTLKEMGVTRISMGCQTFDPEVQKICNRYNNEDLVQNIVDNLKKYGIANNIDMMIGLPGQTTQSVNKDLKILDKISPDAIEYLRHEIVNPLAISIYDKRPELVVKDNDLFEMVIATQEWMEKKGYEQNGHYSSDKFWKYRYYWLKELPIISFGSRARSYTKTICFDKHEEIGTYDNSIKKGIPPIGRYMFLDEKEQMYRSLHLQLQIKNGLDVSEFETRFGKNPFNVFKTIIQKLEKLECIKTDNKSIKLTKYGACFVEDICDYIIDTALNEESEVLTRSPHSEGKTSSRLN